MLAAAAGYAQGWARNAAAGSTTVVRLGPRATAVVLRLLDADRVPVEGAAGSGALPVPVAGGW